MGKQNVECLQMKSTQEAELSEINALMQNAEFRDLAAISEALMDRPLDEIEAAIVAGLRWGRERRRQDRLERCNPD